VAPWLLVGFLALPIVEIALFIVVGGAIGLWPTLGLVVLAAVAGVALMRRQGLKTLERLTASVEAGGGPGEPLAHGALVLVAGLLLLIPGFFTDAAGLVLLVPAVRARLIGWGASRVIVRTAHLRTGGSGPRRPETIEADYEVVDERPARPGTSGWTRPDG
jgi:UPF0716 protein FxsA